MPLTTKRQFIKSTVAALLSPGLIPTRSWAEETSSSKHPELLKIGKKFRFVIFADPHVEHANYNVMTAPEPHDKASANLYRLNLIGAHAHDNLKQAVKEINTMIPSVDFVVHLGDMVESADAPSIANWKDCVAGLKPLPVLVHGNHEDMPDYPIFRQMQKDVNGITDVNYSFDCGNWHFITLPCNLGRADQASVQDLAAMYDFLEKDLEANQHRPTIILHHLHFLPIGLSQTEWYCHPLDIRLRLRDLYSKYGNVKWAFNGHVHNGIMTSIKTSWEYRGTSFINCPNIIDSRPFSEEFPGFEDGMKRGGYYLVVDIDGDSVAVTGRLAGVDSSHVYPDHFTPFTDAVEPRHFSKILDLAPAAAFVNGDFSQDMTGWQVPFRYLRDKDPLYVREVTDRVALPGKKSFYIRVQASGDRIWAQDEYAEIFQIFTCDPTQSPALSANYQIPSLPVAGGGYLRVQAMTGNQFQFMMFFRWGNQENVAEFFPICMAAANIGAPGSWSYFQQLASRKQGFYFHIPSEPNTWHHLEADLGALYNEATGIPQGYQQKKIDKLFLALGTWNGPDLNSQSDAYFSDIQIAPQGSGSSKTDAGPLLAGPDIFKSDFGLDYARDLKGWKRRNGMEGLDNYLVTPL